VQTINQAIGSKKVVRPYHAYNCEEVIGVDQSAAQMENTTRIEQAQIDGGNHRYGKPYGY